MSGFDKDEILRLLDHIDLEAADGPGPMGWIYFIICADLARCKIGFTKGDVYKRMKGLQTGSSSELILIAKHPGTTDTERRLHERFAASRIQGEWFGLTSELRAYMVQTVWTMTEFALRGHMPVETWMLAGTQVTADQLGCCSEGLIEVLEAEA